MRLSLSDPPKKIPAHPDVVRGLEAQRRGKPAIAEALYRKVLTLDPANFDAQSLLGGLLAQGGRLRDGLHLLEAAAAVRPQSTTVQRNIGIVRLRMNDAAGALSAFQAALRTRPDDIESLRGQARCLALLKNWSEAETCLRNIVKLSPRSQSDLTDLGALLADTGKYAEGLEALGRAAKLAPAVPLLHYHAARCFRGLHEFEKARDALLLAEAIDPKHPAILMSLAEVQRELNNSEAALSVVERCLAGAPENSTYQALKASLLLDLGRRAEAHVLYRGLAGVPRHRASALLELAQSKTLTAEDPDAALILDSRAEGLAAADLAVLAFARGKCLEDLSQYDAAFDNYAKARRIRAAAVSGVAPTGPEVMRRAFEKPLFLPGHFSELPVFIVGMPRSGTSLVEQIIASHPQAAGAGELPEMIVIGRDLGLLRSDAASIRGAFSRIDAAAAQRSAERYLAALSRAGKTAALRVADKMPHNFMMLGLIARLFPQARVVHVKRDPADTCLSCFANNLSDYHRYANDLTALGSHYADYDRLMRHWGTILPLAMHEIEYETLVDEPERESRNLIAFLGLEWNERCLRFFEQAGTVSTFSRGQVRQPIYRRSIGRWRKFHSHLTPLFAGLGELAPRPSSVSNGPSSTS